MTTNQATRGAQITFEVVTTKLTLDGSTASLAGFRSGTVAVDPAEIAAGEKATVDVTISGLAATDLVVLEPPAALEDGILVVGCRAKAGGVDLDLYNATGGAVDAAEATWTYKALLLR